jgi:hypothetical protein
MTAVADFLAAFGVVCITRERGGVRAVDRAGRRRQARRSGTVRLLVDAAELPDQRAVLGGEMRKSTTIRGPCAFF